VRLATPLSFGFSARPNKNSDFKEYWFLNGLVFDGESYRTAETCFSLQFTYKQFRAVIQVWRPVRESNPCRRREREAIYRNSKETCGVDSTVR